MPGLIIGGKQVPVPGLNITNYKDQPVLKLRAGDDMRERVTRWVRSIVWHNTKNIPTQLKLARGPYKDIGEKVAKFWSTSPAHAGAHLVVDWDGSVTCHADLLFDATYHASTVNEVSVGIEMFEDEHGLIFESQMQTAVLLTTWLCERFGIQKQMPDPYYNHVISRVAKGGTDTIGVFGHCHQYNQKQYDPSNHVFEALQKAGFKIFNFELKEDVKTWKNLQRKLGVPEDGIPGPATRDALQAAGFHAGLYDWANMILEAA